MDTPRISIAPLGIDVVTPSANAILGLATRVVDTLRRYPHFVVLEGAKPTEDRTLSVELAKAVARGGAAVTGTSSAKLDKVSFTRVQIDPEKLKLESAGTRYSRTNRPMELHTDVSHSGTPPELLAFQMVRADAVGGDSLMMAVEDVVANLASDVRARLEQPSFPFGRENYPVLWKQDGAQCIRYYRTNIDEARSEGAELTADSMAAIDALDRVLLREDLSFRFHVEPGETVFINNTKVLHGRTGFASDSRRLMYRIRVHASSLN